jgi:hypothetical protein
MVRRLAAGIKDKIEAKVVTCRSAAIAVEGIRYHHPTYLRVAQAECTRRWLTAAKPIIEISSLVRRTAIWCQMEEIK